MPPGSRWRAIASKLVHSAGEAGGLALVRESPERHVSAKVRLTERLNSLAPQRTLARDLDGEVGPPSGEDSAPRLCDATDDSGPGGHGRLLAPMQRTPIVTTASWLGSDPRSRQRYLLDS
jgi:hypothetical protein